MTATAELVDFDDTVAHLLTRVDSKEASASKTQSGLFLKPGMFKALLHPASEMRKKLRIGSNSNSEFYNYVGLGLKAAEN